MKYVLFLFALATQALFLFVTPQTAYSQEPDAAIMEAWSKSMAPREEHKMLAKMEGEWTYESKMWMEPGQPPMVSSGESVKTMIMKGRYLEEKFTGKTMGMDFFGQGLTGFDNVRKLFVGTWIDNFGTGIMFTSGEVLPAGNAFELAGVYRDPITNEEMNVRMVTRILSEDEHAFEYFETYKDKEESKTMEINLTRKK